MLQYQTCLLSVRVYILMSLAQHRVCLPVLGSSIGVLKSRQQQLQFLFGLDLSSFNTLVCVSDKNQYTLYITPVNTLYTLYISFFGKGAGVPAGTDAILGAAGITGRAGGSDGGAGCVDGADGGAPIGLFIKWPLNIRLTSPDLV